MGEVKLMTNKDGVHLIGPAGEYALCGDAIDIGSEKGEEDMRDTTVGTVTCKRCAEVLNLCGAYKQRNLRRKGHSRLTIKDVNIEEANMI